jgi:hypothetical protein
VEEVEENEGNRGIEMEMEGMVGRQEGTEGTKGTRRDKRSSKRKYPIHVCLSKPFQGGRNYLMRKYLSHKTKKKINREVTGVGGCRRMREDVGG